MSGISVECLKKVTFSLLPLSEKLEIITRGRPTPSILVQTFRVGKTKKFLRTFNREWYEKIKWLCGCEATNALFCFPCLLFGGDTVWTQNGFTNITKMKEKTGKHQNSRRHMANMISLSLLSQINMSDQLAEPSEMLNSDKQVKEYREELSSAVDCLKLSAKFELAFRRGGSTLCNALENFLSNFNPTFKKHMLISGENAVAVQKEILGHMLEVSRQHIVAEVEEASYVSVVCEDAADISEKIHTIVFFRYEHHGVARERFWGFLDRESVGREGVSNCLLSEIGKVLKKDRSKLVGHSFSGSVRDGRPNIRGVYCNAHFVHSCSSEFDLTLKRMTASIKSVRLFFAKLASLDRFFKESPARLTMLCKYINSGTALFDSLDICTVYNNKSNLIKCLEDLTALKVTDQTLEASTRFLAFLRSEGFSFWLELFNEIIVHLKLFYHNVNSGDLSEVSLAVDEFCKLMRKICNSVSLASAEGPQKLECQEVSNCICDEVRQRFAFVAHLTALQLFSCKNFDKFHSDLPKAGIREVCSAYPDLDELRLRRELGVLYTQKKFQRLTPPTILSCITQEGLTDVFSEAIKLLRILVATPMALEGPEGSSSSVRKVRSLIGDSVSEEKLTALCMVSVEGEMLSQIKNFNEKVVQKYCDNGELELI